MKDDKDNVPLMNGANKKKRSVAPLIVWSLVLVGSVGTIGHLFSRPISKRPTIDAPPVPVVEGTSNQEQARLRQARAEFFDASVAPVVQKTHQENKLAADRCITKIEDLFDGYSEGTKPFVDDIMSFGSRWQALNNLGRDWWYEDDSNGRMVSETFQNHYFTEEKLTTSLTELLNDFRDEILANQRKMLSEIIASASSSETPELIIPSYDTFSQDIKQKLKGMSADAATNSVSTGIVTMIVSEAGTIAVQQLVVQILARFGTAAATTAAAGSGSAMVGGTAAGGGGGAFGGPVGVAVGAATGLAVGIVIDYFMTKSSKAKLTTQMNEVLDDFKTTIITGNDRGVGLKSALNKACDDYNENVKSSFYQNIVASAGDH